MESKTGFLHCAPDSGFNRQYTRGFTSFRAINHHHRHFATPMAVKFFRHKQLLRDNFYKSTPAGAHPDIAMSAMHPTAANPDCTRMRTIPMAADPNPAPTPIPKAINPDESRVGGDWSDFDLRRRRFAGLFHHDFGIWRRSDWRGRGLLDINRAVAIDHPAFHAAGQKRQRSGD
jgi:hypothetical protein